MKSNLDNLFKADTSLEKEGAWFIVSDTVKFRLRRFGGSNSQRVKLSMAKWHKPKARLIELEQLSIEETNLIMSKVFAEACLVEWEGIEIDGEVAVCNFENAVKLFTGLPDLFSSLWKYCEGFESFKEDLGNS